MRQLGRGALGLGRAVQVAHVRVAHHPGVHGRPGVHHLHHVVGGLRRSGHVLRRLHSGSSLRLYIHVVLGNNWRNSEPRGF